MTSSTTLIQLFLLVSLACSQTLLKIDDEGPTFTGWKYTSGTAATTTGTCNGETFIDPGKDQIFEKTYTLDAPYKDFRIVFDVYSLDLGTSKPNLWVYINGEFATRISTSSLKETKLGMSCGSYNLQTDYYSVVNFTFSTPESTNSFTMKFDSTYPSFVSFGIRNVRIYSIPPEYINSDSHVSLGLSDSSETSLVVILVPSIIGGTFLLLVIIFAAKLKKSRRTGVMNIRRDLFKSSHDPSFQNMNESSIQTQYMTQMNHQYGGGNNFHPQYPMQTNQPLHYDPMQANQMNNNQMYMNQTYGNQSYGTQTFSTPNYGNSGFS